MRSRVLCLLAVIVLSISGARAEPGSSLWTEEERAREEGRRRDNQEYEGFVKIRQDAATGVSVVLSCCPDEEVSPAPALYADKTLVNGSSKVNLVSFARNVGPSRLVRMRVKEIDDRTLGVHTIEPID